MLSQEQTEDISEMFRTIDSDGNGYINLAELGEVLERVDIRLPNYKVRKLIADHDKIQDDKIDFHEFQSLYAELKEELDFGRHFCKHLSRKENIEVHGGMSQQSADGTTHTVKQEEQVAFSNWINRNLKDDPDCQNYLPLDPQSHDLYTKCNDGILFCKMINISQPGTIDERTMNKATGAQGYKKLSVYQIHENLTLGVNSASSIGCNIINIGPEDLRAGKPHLVLGLLWQVIRIGLLSDINLQDHPNLANLLREGESLEQLRALSPEEILIRWVNYHLERSNCGRQISNFTSDIKDSIVYIHLINQIAPREKGVTTLAENEPDELERAERMLQEAEKIECRAFVSKEDVVNGNSKLNLAFVANLFNMYPALEDVDDDLAEKLVEETREEKTYRNWMNSLGVSPYVSYLLTDLADGLIILQLEDIIRPGCVDWSKIHRKFRQMRITFEQLENCNECVAVARNLKLSLIGISGDNIKEGSQVHILGMLWQLLRLYTVSVLINLKTKSTEQSVQNGDVGSPPDNKPIVDAEIINWANEKLRKAGKKTSIKSFSDPSISEGLVIIDLVDAIKKGCIKYDLVTPGKTEEEKLSNAKYVISMARKIGARVYALPEDIVEVEKKMVLTIFACLMARDMQPDQKRLH